MKTFFYIISIVTLTTACSLLPSSCPSLTDHIIGTIVAKDSIFFPDKYEVVEEIIDADKKGNWYNACFKLPHSEIVAFVSKNKLKVDTSMYRVSRPSGLALLKKETRKLNPMPQLWKNNTEIYADTVENKIYISKRY